MSFIDIHHSRDLIIEYIAVHINIAKHHYFCNIQKSYVKHKIVTYRSSFGALSLSCIFVIPHFELLQKTSVALLEH